MTKTRKLTIMFIVACVVVLAAWKVYDLICIWLLVRDMAGGL